MNEQVQSELKKIFKGRFSTSVSTRTNYARGEDTFDPVLSKAVVFPFQPVVPPIILRLAKKSLKPTKS